MNSVQFSQLVTTFCKQRNISDMQLQENACSLRRVETTVNIYNDEAQEEVYLCSPLGRGPTEPEERLRMYTSLMESNCFYAQTGGGIFGVSANGELTFTLKFPAEALDANTLTKLFSLYFGIIDAQMQQLQDLATQTNSLLPAQLFDSVRA